MKYFCDNCGNNDHEGFDIEDNEKDDTRTYRCNNCYHIIHIIELDLIRDMKYQRTGERSKK